MAWNRNIFPGGFQSGGSYKMSKSPTRDRGIARSRLLKDIVHGFKGFGKTDFVLTKPGGRDKQNTWEAG
jgi:hypothetical protein